MLNVITSAPAVTLVAVAHTNAFSQDPAAGAFVATLRYLVAAGLSLNNKIGICVVPALVKLKSYFALVANTLKLRITFCPAVDNPKIDCNLAATAAVSAVPKSKAAPSAPDLGRQYNPFGLFNAAKSNELSSDKSTFVVEQSATADK